MSNRRPHLILIGIILAALGGVALIGIPGSPMHKKTTLGLDLQGGLEVVLKAKPPKRHTLTSGDLDRSVTIIRNRIDKLGVSEPDVRKQPPDQIVIELAGVHDTKRALDIIGKTAQLELYDLETSLTGPSVGGGTTGVAPLAETSLYRLLSGEQAAAKKGSPSAYYLFDKKAKRLIFGPSDTRSTLLKDARASLAGSRKPFPKTTKVLAVPENQVVITCGQKGDRFCPGVNAAPPTRLYYYLFKHTTSKSGGGPFPQMTGTDLNGDGIRADFGPNNDPIVLLSFTDKGGGKFTRITKDEYVRGQLQNAPQHFAIVLDRDIKSYPQIDYTDPQLADGISGGGQITGIGSINEANDLALVLQTGALPVSFVPIERTDVSATLGKDSLNQAKTAALIGLLLVALFLLVLYRFLGLVAVIGLGIYAAFLYAAILLFGVTLTLPGFAGLILTIGVAADANVVVFERIKEEVRAGKSVRAAIAAGYAKGFHTIIDANVVTVITAMVLFAVATAGVKGFALMLMIGTLISLVTAVAATRAMLGLLAGFRWFDNPRFMGAHGAQGAKWLQIDFMRKRRVWFAISATIVAIGAGALAVKGLNLGIDFKGGTQVTFSTTKPVSISDVRSQMAAIHHGDAVVQGRGKQSGSESYKSFQIRTKTLGKNDTNKLSGELTSRYGQNIPLQINVVSSSFGRQIARSAITAIIVSLLLVVLYVAVRFDFKFAVPVILAMVHDVVICVGVYALTGREVTNATVAAVLTVLGYSIYDTIIIFDRIRENIPLMRRSSAATITNVSLWETIRRSLATTLITLLPIGSLLLFGGATLKDFAFALMVGIVSGAYSSIFIAAPLLTIWKEREPEFARRKDTRAPSRADGDKALEDAEEAAAEEPTPELAPVAAVERAISSGKRDRRRQRRRSRPHGRAR